jgi:hypothetical protein
LGKLVGVQRPEHLADSLPGTVCSYRASNANYQGLFLRGFGSQTSTHYGFVAHTSNSIGALQGDTIRNIYGDIISNESDEPLTVADNNAGDITSSGAIWYSHMKDFWYGGDGGHNPGYTQLHFDASRVTPTATEIRPINRAVRYLIRALP